MSDSSPASNTSRRSGLHLALAAALIAAVAVFAATVDMRNEMEALERRVETLQRHRGLAPGVVYAEPPSDDDRVEEPFGKRSTLRGQAKHHFSGTGGQTTVTSGLTKFSETVRIGPMDTGTSVDELQFECHGGIAHLGWEIGNLEGITSFAGITLTMIFDDEPIASSIQGADGHTYQDEPTGFPVVRPCGVGRHTVKLRLSRVDGHWGFPYVVNPGQEPADVPILRGFIVKEVW